MKKILILSFLMLLSFFGMSQHIELSTNLGSEIPIGAFKKCYNPGLKLSGKLTFCNDDWDYRDKSYLGLEGYSHSYVLEYSKFSPKTNIMHTYYDDDYYGDFKGWVDVEFSELSIVKLGFELNLLYLSVDKFQLFTDIGLGGVYFNTSNAICEEIDDDNYKSSAMFYFNPGLSCNYFFVDNFGLRASVNYYMYTAFDSYTDFTYYHAINEDSLYGLGWTYSYATELGVFFKF